MNELEITILLKQALITVGSWDWTQRNTLFEASLGQSVLLAPATGVVAFSMKMGAIL